MASKPIFPDVPAWPTPASDAPPPAGHNKPPVEETVAAEFREELLRERPDFMARFDQMIDAADRCHVKDDETLGRAGDLVNMYRAASQHIDATHKAVKEPYLKGGRAADAEKNAMLARLDPVGNAVKGKMNAYIAQREAEERAERQRIEAEQRRQAAAAAEAERARQAAAGENDPEAIAEIETVALAPASVGRAEPVRSDAGSTVSGKQVWNSRVDDYAKAFKAVKSDPKVKEAIEGAIARLVRAGRRALSRGPQAHSVRAGGLHRARSNDRLLDRARPAPWQRRCSEGTVGAVLAMDHSGSRGWAYERPDPARAYRR